jgi:hypothetical protein
MSIGSSYPTSRAAGALATQERGTINGKSSEKKGQEGGREEGRQTQACRQENGQAQGRQAQGGTAPRGQAQGCQEESCRAQGEEARYEEGRHRRDAGSGRTQACAGAQARSGSGGSAGTGAHRAQPCGTQVGGIIDKLVFGAETAVR